MSFDRPTTDNEKLADQFIQSTWVDSNNQFHISLLKEISRRNNLRISESELNELYTANYTYLRNFLSQNLTGRELSDLISFYQGTVGSKLVQLHRSEAWRGVLLGSLEEKMPWLLGPKA